MRFISLCSGIEAATVAWAPLGFKPVAYSEVDDFASAVLSQRLPETPNLGDMTTVDWTRYRGAVDIAIGGPPCQEFSMAGLREGVAGDRGRLYLDYLRAARDAGARWVVAENVPGILSVHGGVTGSPSSRRWQNFGLMAGRAGGCLTLRCSGAPRDVVVSTLLSTLPTGDELQRSSVTAKCATGLLRRMGKRGRKLPDDMDLTFRTIASQAHKPTQS